MTSYDFAMLKMKDAETVLCVKENYVGAESTLPKLMGLTGNFVHGKIFYFGGYSKHAGSNNAVWILDTKLNQWQQASCKPSNNRLPAARFHHAATVTSEAEILIYGGITSSQPSQNSKILNDCWILDVAKNIYLNEQVEWKSVQVSGTLLPRWGHAMVHVDNSVFIFGGAKDSSMSQLCKLNLSTWESKVVDAKGLAPAGRVFLSMVAHKTKLFVYGGEDEEGATSYEMAEFDIPSCCWTRVKLVSYLPVTQRLSRSFLKEDYIFYIFGDTIKHSTTINVYCIQRRVWCKPIQIDALEYREAPAVEITPNGCIYIFGGRNSENVITNDVFKLTISDGFIPCPMELADSSSKIAPSVDPYCACLIQ